MDRKTVRFLDKIATEFFNWLYMEVDAVAKNITETDHPMEGLMRKHNTIESISIQCRNYVQKIHEELNKKGKNE